MSKPAGSKLQEPQVFELNARTLRVGSQPLSIWLLALGSWAMLGLLLPYIGVDDFAGVFSRPAGILAFITIQWSTVRICRFVLDGRGRLMAINFWVFVYFFFGLTAFIQVEAGDFNRRLEAIGQNYPQWELTRAQIIVLVGCFCYEIGGLLIRQRQPRRFRTDPGSRTISLSALHILSVIVLIGELAFVVKSGTSIIGTRQSLGRFGSGSIITAIRMTSLSCAYLITYAFRRGRILRWKALQPPSKLLFITVVGLCLLVNNPTTTPRSAVAVAYGALAIAYFNSDSKRFIRTLTLGFIFSLILVYPLLNTFRDAGGVTPISRSASSGALSYLRETGTDFGMYTQVADGIEYVNAYGYDFGRFQLSSALVFVPRSIWSGKSYDVGDTIHDKLGYFTRFNYSSPLWQESYVEGGFIWVVAVFLLFGALSQLLDLMYLQFPTGMLGIMTPVLAFFQPYLLRGSSLAAMPLLYALVIPMLFVLRRPKRMSPAIEAPPSPVSA